MTLGAQISAKGTAKPPKAVLGLSLGMSAWAGSSQAVPCCIPGLAAGGGQRELGLHRPLSYLWGFLKAQLTDWEKEGEISFCPTKAFKSLGMHSEAGGEGKHPTLPAKEQGRPCCPGASGTAPGISLRLGLEGRGEGWRGDGGAEG